MMTEQRFNGLSPADKKWCVSLIMKKREEPGYVLPIQQAIGIVPESSTTFQERTWALSIIDRRNQAISRRNSIESEPKYTLEVANSTLVEEQPRQQQPALVEVVKNAQQQHVTPRLEERPRLAEPAVAEHHSACAAITHPADDYP